MPAGHNHTPWLDYVTITVLGVAGGVDAMDWTEMLERMYQRWCTAQGYTWTVLQRQAGEEAGLKTLEVEVEGRFAYGYLKGVAGNSRSSRLCFDSISSSSRVKAMDR
jgi:peptide chain release factor 2